MTEVKYRVTISANSEEELDAVVAFCTQNNIVFNVKPCDIRQEMDSIKQTPSKELKAFCGTENLTSRGQVSLDWAVEVVKNYIRVKSVPMVGDTVYLDDRLRELFGISVSTLELNDIRTLLRPLLFTKV